EKLIFGLGIRHIGTKAASILAANFVTIDALLASDYDDIVAIDEIGEVMAESVIKSLNEPLVSDLLNQLKDLCINITYTGTPLESLTDDTLLFTNQRSVLTGRLASFTRREAKDLIKRLGVEVISSVSKNTGLVVAGEASG